MKKLPSRIIFSFSFCFFIFSMLLNSMGAVIIKLSEAKYIFKGLGVLEAFKDLPIVLVSIFLINTIHKFGSKKALLLSLLLAMLGCFLIPLVNEFWFYKIWFSIIGISFALGKIAIYSAVKQNILRKDITRTMNLIEASFMAGIVAVNLGFGILLSSQYHHLWKMGFWAIGILALFTFFLLLTTKLDEIKSKETNHKGFRFFNVFENRAILFLLLILFLIVFIEQSFNSWLPAFHKLNVSQNSFLSLQLTAFLALLSFISRYVTGKIINKFSLSKYIGFCLVSLLLFLSLSQLLLFFGHKNFAAYLLPLCGLFTAPLYPIYSSTILKKTEKDQLSSSLSMIMVFSSIGSSLGSIYMSFIFHYNWSFFYPVFIILPLIFIFGLTPFVKKKTKLDYD